MHTYTHHVRYHEVDGQGFLFNARYLEIADVAMTEFLRALGWSYSEFLALGADPSVVSAKLTFSAPTRFDDRIDVDVTCPHVGNASFELHMTFTRDDDPVARVELVYVNVDTEAAASRPLPAAVAAGLRSVG
ncbi:thioesterase family protein [Tsukamurella sp. 8F]|uniref:acyl-CoA thioesterase n=1 Tax=unclassified Tsukamurella TaxID=2633480 RepID=UPI0023B99616|nr:MULTISPECIES: thioesterase family protein [unclassified Tsukamurella]MDF0528880.1 thioesterase family protein [Tsukamurella sp. 8J]MDF0586715.1 thioesterase family protein [Tsukamurella sp. 8F]